MINHKNKKLIVMLVEIPDLEVILGVVSAFVVGLLSLFLFYRIKPHVIKKERYNLDYHDRFDFYEKQLIDMKIRLDAFDLEKNEPEKNIVGLRNEVKGLINRGVKPTRSINGDKKETSQRIPNMDFGNITDKVLGHLTEHPMTSRDIQITLGRTREHTSRLLKKLYQDGFVKRNTSSKPYTYSITEKGKQKLNVLKTAPQTA